MYSASSVTSHCAGDTAPPFQTKAWSFSSSRLEQIGLLRGEPLELGHHLVEVISHGLAGLGCITSLECGENGAMLLERILVAAGGRQQEPPRPLELGPRHLDHLGDPAHGEP